MKNPLNYQMTEYDCGLFVALRYDITDKAEYDIIRNDSSVTLHKLLLSHRI